MHPVKAAYVWSVGWQELPQHCDMHSPAAIGAAHDATMSCPACRVTHCDAKTHLLVQACCGQCCDINPLAGKVCHVCIHAAGSDALCSQHGCNASNQSMATLTNQGCAPSCGQHYGQPSSACEAQWVSACSWLKIRPVKRCIRHQAMFSSPPISSRLA